MCKVKCGTLFSYSILPVQLLSLLSVIYPIKMFPAHLNMQFYINITYNMHRYINKNIVNYIHKIHNTFS